MMSSSGKTILMSTSEPRSLPTGAPYMIRSPALGHDQIAAIAVDAAHVNQLWLSSSMAALPPSWRPCIKGLSCGSN
jgi:hypothetical protein